MSNTKQQRLFFGPREIAEILGVNINCVRNLYRSGRLPHIRTGRLVLININDLKALRYTPGPDGNSDCPADLKRKAAMEANRRKQLEEELELYRGEIERGNDE